MKKAILYIHGKGGSYLEAEQYKEICIGYDVIGIDYNEYLPWIVENQIKSVYENSEFDLKDDSRQENVSDSENDADEDALKNQLQMALDGFVNEGNKPSETIDSSAMDDNEDDSEDDDLQFIDLN